MGYTTTFLATVCALEGPRTQFFRSWVWFRGISHLQIPQKSTNLSTSGPSGPVLDKARSRALGSSERGSWFLKSGTEDMKVTISYRGRPGQHGSRDPAAVRIHLNSATCTWWFPTLFWWKKPHVSTLQLSTFQMAAKWRSFKEALTSVPQKSSRGRNGDPHKSEGGPL